MCLVMGSRVKCDGVFGGRGKIFFVWGKLGDMWIIKEDLGLFLF